MSRLAAHQKQQGNYDENHGPPAREEPLPFHRSSRQQHRKPAPDQASGNEENVAHALNTTTSSSSSSFLAKPVASTISAAASTLSCVASNPTTPARKPKTPAKFGGTASKISTATPQRLQQDASTMLIRLRQALARVQGESQRMSTFAQQPRLKARGGAAGAVAPPRPSAEVLDMCRRLVAATESAVKNLQVMFPMVVVREVEEGREGGKQEGEEGDKMEMESAQGKALMLESLGVPAVTGRRPSIVAEEEEEEEGVGEEEEEGDEESLEEGEIREETYTPKSRTPVASVRSRAGTPATLAAVSVAAAESAAVSVAAAESEELRSLVEEVGQQLVEGEEEDVRDDKKAEEKEVGSREDDVATTAGAGAAAVEAEAVPLNMEMTEEENEKEDEDEEDEEEAEGV
eukprot:evm.model.NODE_39448_length_22869_cov_24.273470.1